MPGALVLRAVLLLSFASLGGVAEAAQAWRLGGEVRVTVPVKPGGGFEAVSRAVAGSLAPSGARPVRLAGEVTLDLATIDTGIALRNRHLREKYLEVARGRGFDQAVLSEIAVTEAAGADFRGRSAFTATLMLHGVTRPVLGSVEIRGAGEGARVEAGFPLTLTEFGIEPPEYLGVGVANKVFVSVKLDAVPSGQPR